TEGNISALNIPHSSIVFDLHDVTEIRADLLGDAGIAVEEVKHANLVSFTSLKALAFDQRFERKDAHDLIYCIEHAEEGLDGAARTFHMALQGDHGAVISDCLSILRNRFARDDEVEGYRKDGPVAVVRFELGEGGEAYQREARVLRQREVSSLIEQLLARIGVEAA
ncbi:MAG: antitoxin, partial [Rhodospirillaceae bacterium]|nr:antitoxin [Rhodospirillaceae bacterium]